MDLQEIIKNAGYDSVFLEETAGKEIARASKRFNISNWEEESGDQLGVSFELLKAVAQDQRFSRQYWATRILKDRRHCFADAQNMI